MVAGTEEEPFERTTDAEESKTPGIVVHACIGHGVDPSDLGACEYGHWTVSHTTTGRRFPWFFPDRQSAHGFAVSLSDLKVDWTGDIKDRGGALAGATKKAIRERAALHGATST